MKWIESSHLLEWANRMDCQQSLPLLARKLVRASVDNISRIKFPAGENVLHGGWDGILEVTKPTEYLPEGISLWEFGASKNPKQKAEADYNKRSEDPQGFDPAHATFVFVTPRVWKGASEWAKEKINQKIWRDVKVITCEELEEWIELAPAVGSWLAKRINLNVQPSKEVHPCDDFWEKWSTGEKFNLLPELITAGRTAEKKNLISNYFKPGLIPVMGLSQEEAMAFIVASFINTQEEEDFFSRSIIVDTPESFDQLTGNSTPLILIPKFGDSGSVNLAISKGHTVIIPLSAENGGAWPNKIELPKIQREGFMNALTMVGIPKAVAEKLSRETGRNISILRRQLGFDRTSPKWSLSENVKAIIPALLAGRWDEDSEGDRKIISSLAGMSYEDYTRILSPWLRAQDRPVAKIGSKWRLVSPLDAWTYASSNLTAADFKLFHDSLLEVLSEVDPVHQLPSEKRRFASLEGIHTEYSDWLKEGLAESLILAGVYGDKLKLQFGIPSQLWVDDVVRKLLTTQNHNFWRSLDSVLPLIAEASPNQFLASVQQKIDQEHSPVQALFKEEEGFYMNHSYHTGLLWALESLAWDREYLSRVTLILGRLAQNDPGGALANRPINSLSEIFKPWHYQTLANFSERIAILKLLSQQVPSVAWTLLVRMLPAGGGSIGNFTRKTRWRLFGVHPEQHIETDAYYWPEIYKTHASVVELLLSLYDFSEDQTTTLLSASVHLQPADQEKILAVIEAKFDPSKQVSFDAWNTLRNLLSRHRSFPNAKWALDENELVRYELLYRKLEPIDEIQKKIWLFNDTWPQFIEGKQERLSSVEREKQIREVRIAALNEIYASRGLEQILKTIPSVKLPLALGDTLGHIIHDEKEILKICSGLAKSDAEIKCAQSFVFRKTQLVNIDWAFALYDSLRENGLDKNGLAAFLIALPQNSSTWSFVHDCGEELENLYWQKVNPFFHNLSPEEKVLGTQKLNAHSRFIAAITEIHFYADEIPSEEIAQALQGAATLSGETTERIQGYEVEQLFEVIDKRNDLDLNRLITLEWQYLPLLASYGSGRKPTRLHKALSEDPDFFMLVLKWIYKPADEAKAEEIRAGLDDEQMQLRAIHAHDLLESWKKIPGVDEIGNIDSKFLESWINKVRTLAADYGIADAADIHIGEILAEYPEKDGVSWPPNEICILIEKLHSEKVNSNFSRACFNKRSFSSRSPFEGGNIERKKAEYFRKLAADHRNTFPTLTDIFENLAQGYDVDAIRMDHRAERQGMEY